MRRDDDRAMMSVASSSSKPAPALVAEERQRREQLHAAIPDADDPLALYDAHLTWLLGAFAPGQLHLSGIVEFLEEGTRRFAKETAFRKELRNLRLWTTYAALVDKPCPVYKFVLSLGIGTSWASLYLEYALALERENRTNAAEQVLEAGLKRKASPTARLKKALEDLRARIATLPRPPPPPATLSLPRLKGTPETDALRADPLKHHAPAPPKPTQSQAPPRPPSPLATYTTTSVEERYAVIRAPVPPSKRREIMHVDMDALFPGGVIEYSVEEVRARAARYAVPEPTPPPPSPPPAAVREPSPVQPSPPDSPSFSQDVSQDAEVTVDLRRQIDFNDDGTKSSRRYLERRMDRRSIGLSNEPTVTINTKAALADVFGMYNSPDKTVSFAERTPGSKHAPIHKISPPKFDLQPQTPTNPAPRKANGLVEPYVDENAGYKENAAIAKTPTTRENPAVAKFTPFVDKENPPRADAFTPGANRGAFAPKETPAHTPYSSGLGRVFTPASASSVFRAQSLAASTPAAPALRPAFTPLAQSTPGFRIFSGPSENENAGPTPARSGAFTPFVDENASMPTRTPLGERQPLRPAFMMAHEAVQEESEEEVDEVEYSLVEEEEEEEMDYPAHAPQPAYADEDAEDSFEDPPPPSHQTPMGGRLGKFAVLTPITERTYEYASAGRASVHSSGGEMDTGRFFGPPAAASAAARLAAEVRADADGVPLRPATAKMMGAAADEYEHEYEGDEEDPAQGRRPPPFRISNGHALDAPSLREQHAELTEYVERRTETLSLSAKLGLEDRVRQWPNPCNPFDPSIIASILAFFAQDAAHFDFPQEDSAQLDKLQRFARRKASAQSEGVGVTLGALRFLVDAKLGEGGFGAVFAAQRLKPRGGFGGDDSFEDDSFEDEADDEDEDTESRFALKVVKPRNLWEFYVLRKVHATLPADLCASIIVPHALYAYRDESVLMLRLCEQGSLLNVINKAVEMRVSQKGAFLDELLAAFFAVELLRTVGGLHAAGFIHGDLKIDNCLVRLEECGAWAEEYDPAGGGGWARKGITLIDFGRAIDTRLFPRGQQFVAEWETDQRDCAEMRAGRPWTYQADYFGLAGIVFCLLFSRYIDDGAVARAPGGRARLATPLKRYWQTALWTRLFDALLNPGAARADGAPPLAGELAEIRGELERWLVANCRRSTNTLRGLLKKIALAASA